VGASSEINGGSLRAFAYAGLPDGSEWITDAVEGEAGDPIAAGTELAARMVAAGAADLLRRSASA
jgi:porphobilinogen deaminase